MSKAMFSSVDCIMIRVDDLEAALAFYRDTLGHKLVWRTDAAAGLSFGGSDTELLIGVGDPYNEVDIKVESVDEAAKRFEEAGGTILSAPRDIPIGKCAVIQDPWGNQFVILDTSKGLLKTDENGWVIPL